MEAKAVKPKKKIEEIRKAGAKKSNKSGNDTAITTREVPSKEAEETKNLEVAN